MKRYVKTSNNSNRETKILTFVSSDIVEYFDGMYIEFDFTDNANNEYCYIKKYTGDDTPYNLTPYENQQVQVSGIYTYSNDKYYIKYPRIRKLG